jgi:tetratricopeptide (TPR) repeat protein
MSKVYRNTTEGVRKGGNHPVLKIGLPVLLVVIGAAAYSNSFNGPFIFDDEYSIVDNPHILHLWPLGKAMSAPPQATVAGRPIASLSLALNYAISGYSVWSYHLFNLLVHILAGLTLYGIIRRTLLCERLKGRFGKYAAVVAWVAAAMWVAHPLQTESVTYIVQRTESLMGLFYLLTLYSAIRAMGRQRSALWSIISVVCCSLGIGTKEVMATAPALVLLYDRAFFAGSFAGALRRRWGLYSGLAATWAILAVLIWPGPRSATAGFSFSYKPFDYALNQCIVILHYIRLAFWPRGLCLDYNQPMIKEWVKVLPPMTVITAMLAVTVWGLIRNRAWSYPAVWLFGVLSVTSSFVPIADLVFEHRMYLPLAGLTVLVASGGHILFERRSARMLGLIPATVVICALGVVTFLRNEDYGSGVSIWRSALSVVPNNPGAYKGLGLAYDKLGQYEEAIRAYKEAIRIKPGFAEARFNLGVTYSKLGRYEEAARCCEEAIKIKPDYDKAYNNLGFFYGKLGRDAEEIEAYKQSIKISPEYAKTYYNLGIAYSKGGRWQEAIEAFRQVVRIKPEDAEAHYNLGLAYNNIGRSGEAIASLKEAMRIKQDYAEAQYGLGIVYGGLGRWEEAKKALKDAIKIKPGYAEAHAMLGTACLATGDRDSALKEYKILKTLDVKSAERLFNLINQ